MVFEVIDGLVRGLEEAVRLRLEREAHRTTGTVFEFDTMCSDTQHMLSECGDHIRSGDSRLKPERRTLNGWSCSFRCDVGEHLCDIDRILRSFLTAPIGFVNLFLHDASLEGTIGKCIHRV